MEKVCQLLSCGRPFSEEEPELCRGLHAACYQRVYRAMKRERVVLAEARAICQDVGERYGVELVVEDIGNPVGVDPVSWVFLCIDEVIKSRLTGIPDDPLLQLEALSREIGEAPAEV